jgi:hypothetical protein
MNLIFCGVCLGVPALIYSIKARENYHFGRYQEAKENARTAKKFNIAGFVIGSICFIFGVIMQFLFFYTAISSSYEEV